MIKFDANPVSLTYPVDSRKDLRATHRLIVLVPADINFSAATQQIGELAHTTGMHVQLLGLCKDATEESRLRRGLISMSSLLQNDKIPSDVKVEVGTDWVDVLKTNYETEDMIVCFAEQQTGFLRKSLSQILESNFKATVYILSSPTLQKLNSKKFSQISTWLGIIVVIAGFTILQAKIVQLPEGWLQNTLLILSAIPEFWLIWAWDGR